MRLLYVVNHRTLNEIEIPLLEEQGWEVVTTKVVPVRDFRSGAVTFEHDARVTLPRDALELLNAHAFYEKPWPREMAELISAEFDVIVASPGAEVAAIIEAARWFPGLIVARTFGRED